MHASVFLALAVGRNLAFQAEAQVPTLTKPDIHGQSVVFTAEGDLWIGSLEDGSARRLTSDRGTETNAKFSPDGKQIAFSAQYEGGTEVYVIPTSGGIPKRLSYDGTRAEVQGWTPDGLQVIFRSQRNSPVGRVARLWSVPRNGGLASLLPVPRAEFGSLSSSGQLAYVPVSMEWANWFRYQAGATDALWLADLKGGFKKITQIKGIATTPTWCKNDVYFVAEETGSMNLHRLNTSTLKQEAVTRFRSDMVRYPSSDGQHVVFQLGAGLGIYDPKTQTSKPIKFSFLSDFVNSRPRRVALDAGRDGVGLGPTGKRLAVVSRGQLVTVPTQSGDMRILDATLAARATFPSWSPDGKSIAYISDRSGENQIWIAPATGGEAKVLTRFTGVNPTMLSWAPTGNRLLVCDRAGRIWVVDAKTGESTAIHTSQSVSSYDSDPLDAEFDPSGNLVAFHASLENWQQAVFIYEVSSGKKIQLTSPMLNARNASFTPDGKFLCYLGDTNFSWADSNQNRKIAFLNPTRAYLVALDPNTPSPFLPKIDDEGESKPKEAAKTKINLEGISSRVIEVPVPAATYTDLVAVAGKFALTKMTAPDDSSDSSSPDLSLFDIETKKSTSVGPYTISEKSADGKRLLLNSPRGVAVYDLASAPAAVNLAGYTISVQPKAEWRQILRETWRMARDLFYDPGLHGADWNAVWRRYEPRLELVGDRTDLVRLQKELVSELNCGHAYITNPTPGTPSQPSGFLGADFARVKESGAVRISRLLRGDEFSVSLRSPLLEPGINVKEGDYILAIAGQPLSADQDIQARLVGLGGQVTSVTVNSTPSMVGARTVYVRLLGGEEQLRYQDWVRSRIAYVQEHGSKDLGYLHVPDMSTNGMQEFTKGQIGNVYKKGMVYDTRFNGGGYISSLLLENINAKPQAWWKPRTGGAWSREGWANIGHAVAICNEYNFSDGELFIEVWKRMKLGPTVGKRTGGGEVGSGGGYRLLDGGQVFIPAYGAFADGKWIIEGVGATPDFEVDQDPVAVMSGRDPQLDKAIELLLDAIKKNPVSRPSNPPFPKKN